MGSMFKENINRSRIIQPAEITNQCNGVPVVPGSAYTTGVLIKLLAQDIISGTCSICFESAVDSMCIPRYGAGIAAS